MAALHKPQPDGGVKKKLFMALVMDRSASMGRFGDVPLRAINGYLQKLRQSEHARFLEVSVVVFDHATDTLIPMQPVAQVLTLAKYANGKGTRLHGTVADVIEQLIQRVLVEQ